MPRPDDSTSIFTSKPIRFSYSFDMHVYTANHNQLPSTISNIQKSVVFHKAGTEDIFTVWQDSEIVELLKAERIAARMLQEIQLELDEAKSRSARRDIDKERKTRKD